MSEVNLSVQKILERIVILDSVIQDQNKMASDAAGEHVYQSWVLTPSYNEERDIYFLRLVLNQATNGGKGVDHIANLDLALSFAKEDGEDGSPTLSVSVVLLNVDLVKETSGLEIVGFALVLTDLGEHISELAMQATDNLYRSTVKKEKKP